MTKAKAKVEEIRLRAERKAGQLLTEQKERGERRTPSRSVSTSLPTLKDLGISKDQSADWQRLGEGEEPEVSVPSGSPRDWPS